MTNDIALIRAVAALTELIEMNELSDDYDAYCHDLAQWGIGKQRNDDGEWVYSESLVKPNPKDFGL